MVSIKLKSLCMQKSFIYFIFRNAEQQRILWKIPDISQKSENGGNIITCLFYLFKVSSNYKTKYT